MGEGNWHYAEAARILAVGHGGGPDGWVEEQKTVDARQAQAHALLALADAMTRFARAAERTGVEVTRLDDLIAFNPRTEAQEHYTAGVRDAMRVLRGEPPVGSGSA